MTDFVRTTFRQVIRLSCQLSLWGWVLAVLVTGCAEPYPMKEKAASEQPDALEPVEVDLGRFDVTIPNASTNSTILVDFHIFAKMPKYKTEEVSEQLESHAHRFRQDVLLRVRSLGRPTLNEPNLTQLRQEIQEAIEEISPDSKIELIGFYHFRFLEE